MAKAKRRDKSRVVLRTGESQRADGTYHYCWTDANRKRRYVYAKTLDELRYKEEQIEKDKKDGTSIPVAVSLINTPLKKDTDLTMSDPCYGVVVTATNHDNAVAFIKYAFGL